MFHINFHVSLELEEQYLYKLKLNDSKLQNMAVLYSVSGDVWRGWGGNKKEEIPM